MTAVLNEGKGHRLSSETIRRKIADLGLLPNMLWLGNPTGKKRVLLCKERKHWTVHEEWKKWIFSDESHILVDSRSRVYIWRKDDIKHKPYHRGMIVLWCKSAHVGTLTQVEVT